MSWQAEIYMTATKTLVFSNEIKDIEKLIDGIIIEDLTEREGEVLFACFEAVQTLVDLAQLYSVTRQRICAIKKKALKKIKKGIRRRQYESKIINNG